VSQRVRGTGRGMSSANRVASVWWKSRPGAETLSEAELATTTWQGWQSSVMEAVVTVTVSDGFGVCAWRVWEISGESSEERRIPCW